MGYSYSNNIIAVKTLIRSGIDKVVTLARALHITGDISASPSLALGCVDVTVKEAAAAFNVFAHDGVYVEPYLIAWVKDEWGSKVYRYKEKSERVLESRVVGQVAKVLSIGIKRYLNRLNITDFTMQAICKTGTTNDYKDALTIGYTPQLTVGVWVGNNDNTPMDSIAGSLGAAPIWRQMMEYFLKGKPIERFTVPPSVLRVTICKENGLRAENATTSAMTEYFLSGTIPTKSCTEPQPSITEDPTPTTQPVMQQENPTPTPTQQEQPTLTPTPTQSILIDTPTPILPSLTITP